MRVTVSSAAIPAQASPPAGADAAATASHGSALDQSPMTPTASVVVCAYTIERWDDIVAAVASIRDQETPASEIILVIDHNDALFTRARAAFEDVTVLANTGPRGLSGARNTGVSAAHGDVVVFLDDDARGEPDWLDHLLAPYADPTVQGVGGAAVPTWPASGRPPWFPPEFDWVVGCSYTGLPTTIRPVRNPIGAAMSFRRVAFDRIGGFTDGIGRIGSIPLGCEETEFGIRLRQADPTATILFEPRAAVHHRVTEQRATFTYFRQRCYAEGLSKAMIAKQVGEEAALDTERAYVRRTLPRAVWREIRTPGRRLSAVTIVSGVAITTVGYLRGRLLGPRTGSRLRNRRGAEHAS